MSDDIPYIRNSLPEPKTRWTAERVARLGFLIGRGWSAEKVAADPLIVSTPNNVHRQAQRFGLAFREGQTGGLPSWARKIFDEAALPRGLTGDKLIELMLATIAREPTLIDNVLDDGDDL